MLLVASYGVPRGWRLWYNRRTLVRKKPFTEEAAGAEMRALISRADEEGSRRIFAMLSRLLRDFDQAEGALHKTLRAAPEQ